MRITKNIFFANKTIIVDILMILLIGMISITWFKGNFLIDIGDQYLPFSPFKDFQNYIFYAWIHLNSTGLSSPQSVAALPYLVFFAIFEIFDFSLVFSQKVLYYLLFSTCGVSMYYLSTNLIRNSNRRIISLSSAFFYMFNFFSLLTFWRPGITSIFFYATTPLILGLYIKFLNTRKVQYAIFLLIILSTVTVIAFGNPVHLIILLLILLSYLSLYVSQKVRTRQIV